MTTEESSSCRALKQTKIQSNDSEKENASELSPQQASSKPTSSEGLSDVWKKSSSSRKAIHTQPTSVSQDKPSVSSRKDTEKDLEKEGVQKDANGKLFVAKNSSPADTVQNTDIPENVEGNESDKSHEVETRDTSSAEESTLSTKQSSASKFDGAVTDVKKSTGVQEIGDTEGPGTGSHIEGDSSSSAVKASTNSAVKGCAAHDATGAEHGEKMGDRKPASLNQSTLRSDDKELSNTETSLKVPSPQPDAMEVDIEVCDSEMAKENIKGASSVKVAVSPGTEHSSIVVVKADGKETRPSQNTYVRMSDDEEVPGTGGHIQPKGNGCASTDKGSSKSISEVRTAEDASVTGYAEKSRDGKPLSTEQSTPRSNDKGLSNTVTSIEHSDAMEIEVNDSKIDKETYVTGNLCQEKSEDNSVVPETEDSSAIVAEPDDKETEPNLNLVVPMTGDAEVQETENQAKREVSNQEGSGCTSTAKSPYLVSKACVVEDATGAGHAENKGRRKLVPIEKSALQPADTEYSNSTTNLDVSLPQSDSMEIEAEGGDSNITKANIKIDEQCQNKQERGPQVAVKTEATCDSLMEIEGKAKSSETEASAVVQSPAFSTVAEQKSGIGAPVLDAVTVDRNSFASAEENSIDVAPKQPSHKLPVTSIIKDEACTLTSGIGAEEVTHGPISISNSIRGEGEGLQKDADISEGHQSAVSTATIAATTAMDTMEDKIPRKSKGGGSDVKRTLPTITPKTVDTHIDPAKKEPFQETAPPPFYPPKGQPDVKLHYRPPPTYDYMPPPPQDPSYPPPPPHPYGWYHDMPPPGYPPYDYHYHQPPPYPPHHVHHNGHLPPPDYPYQGDPSYQGDHSSPPYHHGMPPPPYGYYPPKDPSHYGYHPSYAAPPPHHGHHGGYSPPPWSPEQDKASSHLYHLNSHANSYTYSPLRGPPPTSKHPGAYEDDTDRPLLPTNSDLEGPQAPYDRESENAALSLTSPFKVTSTRGSPIKKENAPPAKNKAKSFSTSSERTDHSTNASVAESYSDRASDVSESVPPIRNFVKSKHVANDDRRSRKNALARQRADARRKRVDEIEAKNPEDRTEEEQTLLDADLKQRDRKNNRSRVRSIEQKEQINAILAKPEHERTEAERQFLDVQSNRKRRKNEGDRLRRTRLKILGLGKETKAKVTVTARGPLPAPEEVITAGGQLPAGLVPSIPHYQGAPHHDSQHPPPPAYPWPAPHHDQYAPPPQPWHGPPLSTPIKGRRHFGPTTPSTADSLDSVNC